MHMALTSKTVMLDTNVFNDILSDKLSLQDLGGYSVIATHVQRDELGLTPDLVRRAALLRVFASSQPAMVPTETSIWGDSSWGEAKWSSGDGVYDKLLARVAELDKKRGNKKRPFNQSRDARIAETSLKLGVTLITSDPSLRLAAEELGADVASIEELKCGLPPKPVAV
jgi:rRNA-processing protein FCF1